MVCGSWPRCSTVTVTLMAEPTDKEIAEFEMFAAVLASNLAERCKDVPTHVMAAALDILYAAMVVEKANYVTQDEINTGTFHTDDVVFENIIKGIKSRVDFIRAAMKLAGVSSRAN